MYDYGCETYAKRERREWNEWNERECKRIREEREYEFRRQLKEEARQKREEAQARERRQRQVKILATACCYVGLILLAGYTLYATTTNDAWSLLLKFSGVTVGVLVAEIACLWIAMGRGWEILVALSGIAYVVSLVCDWLIFDTSGIWFDYDLLWLFALACFRALLMVVFPGPYFALCDAIDDALETRAQLKKMKL